MKRLFLLLFAVAPLVATAQPDYRPMLCEGRVWNEHAGAGLYWTKTLYLNGDTVIEGETYKKLYEHATFIINGDTVITDKLQVPVMEKDRRVYAYIHRKVTVYDFTLQPGDSLVLGAQEWVRINKIDTISVKGERYRRFHVTHVMKDFLGVEWSGDADEDAFWVEGIGCDKGLTALFGWLGTAAPYARLSIFDNCTENGETLFTINDFNAPAWKDPEAGGYHPLVVDGKQWHEKSNSEIVDYDFLYTISSDTVIGGESYKKLSLTVTVSPRNEEGQQLGIETQTYGPGVMAWLQERDSMVYRLDKYGHKDVLYDFSLNAGDVAFEDENFVQQVTKVDTILVNGRKLRRLWLTEADKYFGNVRTGCWVEGIGCNYGLETPHGWDMQSSFKMRECIEDGNVIFTAADFNVLSANMIACDVNSDGVVDVADIATVIEAMTVSSDLPPLGEANADVNGDGKVDVADIATIISVMAGQQPE